MADFTGSPSDFALKVYIPSKDPRIQALFAGTYGLAGTMLTLEARVAVAQALSNAGLVIDEEIDGEGQDCLETIQYRQRYGYTRFPDMAQGSDVDPVTGARDYSNPKFAIVVTTDPAAYPPFVTPPPPAPPAPASLVGPYCGCTSDVLGIPGPSVGVYVPSSKALNLPEGFEYTVPVGAPQAGSKFLYHIMGKGLMGAQPQAFWLGPQAA